MKTILIFLCLVMASAPFSVAYSASPDCIVAVDNLVDTSFRLSALDASDLDSGKIVTKVNLLKGAIGKLNLAGDVKACLIQQAETNLWGGFLNPSFVAWTDFQTLLLNLNNIQQGGELSSDHPSPLLGSGVGSVENYLLSMISRSRQAAEITQRNISQVLITTCKCR
ncbi:MAG: hypothetical protein EOP04_10265 [Proteobacteria bacterium]|nr:MAG: hypothetical protein EOP04_10265 [Pseudomonadota bacterium]